MKKNRLLVNLIQKVVFVIGVTQTMTGAVIIGCAFGCDILATYLSVCCLISANEYTREATAPTKKSFFCMQ
jgi:uncharacterized membrane protein